MSNPLTERTVVIDGRPFVLCLTTRAIVQAERASGMTFLEIIDWFRRYSLNGTQAFLYMTICVRQPHVTYDECLDLIERAGGCEALILLLSGQVSELLETTTADPKDLATLGVSAKRPRKARAVKAGTGTGSSSQRDVPA